jgi:rare lipoprotein A
MRAVLIIAATTLLLPGLACAQTSKSFATKSFSGRASYYDKNYKGKTASGAAYDGAQFTAAHRTLAFGTRLRVTDKRTGRSVIVVVTDRGPFVQNVVLDLSYAAAKSLGMVARGIIPIEARLASSTE